MAGILNNAMRSRIALFLRPQEFEVASIHIVLPAERGGCVNKIPLEN